MIQKLIQAIATILQSNLAGVTTQRTLIDAVPPVDQLQILARYLAELQANPNFQDRPVDQSPRFLSATQFVVRPQECGSFLSDHTPLLKTLLVQTVPTAENDIQSLDAGANFTPDPQAILASLPLAVILAAMHETQSVLGELRRLSHDVTKRKHLVKVIHSSHATLERRLEECMAELRTANEQLRQQSAKLERVEAAMAKQLRFETLLSEFSTRFLNLPSNAVDCQIEQGLQRLAEFVEVEQGALFKFSNDQTRLCATHAWTVLECAPDSALVTFDQLPWAIEQLRRGEIVLFSHVSDLPGEATRDKEYLHEWGPKSAVVIPLAVAGSITGAVLLASLRMERPWPSGVVRQLRLVVEIFSNALSRQQADEALQTTHSESSTLQLQRQAEKLFLHAEVKGEDNGIIGQSDVLKVVLFRIQQVASSDTTVLLFGETGVGKELIARAIHQRSPRCVRPLITVNCAALSANLIESELFGHEKGSFTGAAAKRVGRFEMAHGGTLFLDEIGELSLELQAKLLRVLQEGEFERVGSSRTFRVDVRVIAATNRDLEDDVRRSRFRQDLYYRLAVFPITVPALRDRRDDIPLLVRFFIERFAQKVGKAIPTVPSEVMETLQRYSWPGNIRELQNVIQRAVINTQGPSLRLMDTLKAPKEMGLPIHSSRTLAESEAQCIVRALEATHWKIEGKNGAATALNLPASTLRKRMRKLGIQRPETFR